MVMKRDQERGGGETSEGCHMGSQAQPKKTEDNV